MAGCRGCIVGSATRTLRQGRRGDPRTASARRLTGRPRRCPCTRSLSLRLPLFRCSWIPTATPAARQRVITAFADPAIHRQHRDPSFGLDVPIQPLVLKAIGDLFEKHGRPRLTQASAGGHSSEARCRDRTGIPACMHCTCLASVNHEVAERFVPGIRQEFRGGHPKPSQGHPSGIVSTGPPDDASRSSLPSADDPPMSTQGQAKADRGPEANTKPYCSGSPTAAQHAEQTP